MEQVVLQEQVVVVGPAVRQVLVVRMEQMDQVLVVHQVLLEQVERQEPAVLATQLIMSS